MYFILLVLIVAAVIVFRVGAKKQKQESSDKGQMNKLRRQYEGQAVFLASSIASYKKPLKIPDNLAAVGTVVGMAADVVEVAGLVADIADPNSMPGDQSRDARYMLKDGAGQRVPPDKKAIPDNAYSIKGMSTIMIKPGMFMSVGGVRTQIIAIFHDQSSTGFGAASPGQIVDVVIQATETIDVASFSAQIAAQKVLPLGVSQ